MRPGKAALIIATVTLLGASSPSTMQYTYDPVGRFATAVNAAVEICTAYTYDANGNRTAQTTTNVTAPLTSVWGTGTWGCALWSP
jgi:YD repeat-containing protein